MICFDDRHSDRPDRELAAFIWFGRAKNAQTVVLNSPLPTSTSAPTGQLANIFWLFVGFLTAAAAVDAPTAASANAATRHSPSILTCLTFPLLLFLSVIIDQRNKALLLASARDRSCAITSDDWAGASLPTACLGSLALNDAGRTPRATQRRKARCSTRISRHPPRPRASAAAGLRQRSSRSAARRRAAPTASTATRSVHHAPRRYPRSRSRPVAPAVRAASRSAPHRPARRPGRSRGCSSTAPARSRATRASCDASRGPEARPHEISLCARASSGSGSRRLAASRTACPLARPAPRPRPRYGATMNAISDGASSTSLPLSPSSMLVRMTEKTPPTTNSPPASPTAPATRPHDCCCTAGRHPVSALEQCSQKVVEPLPAFERHRYIERRLEHEQAGPSTARRRGIPTLRRVPSALARATPPHDLRPALQCVTAGRGPLRTPTDSTPRRSKKSRLKMRSETPARAVTAYPRRGSLAR